MNISDFERLLRDSNTPQHFPAEEKKWLLLEKDLERKRRGGVIVLSKKMYWVAAASLALLITAGFYTLRNLAFDGKKDVAPTSLGHRSTNQPSVVPQDTAKALSGLKAIPSRAHQSYITKVGVMPPRTNKPQPQQQLFPDSLAITNVPKEGKVKEQQPEQRKPLLPGNMAPLVDNEDTKYAQNRPGGIDFGFSAYYGFSGIAKSQYRISVDAKRSLSKRVFAKVQVVASTASLSAAEQYQYQKVSLGPAGLTPTVSTQETEARYSGKVYNVGLTPSIGFHITKTVSISAGPDVQKSLTGSVTLDNKDEFRNQINNQTLIDEQHEVADIDLGLQSTAQVSISRRLSASLLYRYGFTAYLKKTSGSQRNSFLCVGLSYSLK